MKNIGSLSAIAMVCALVLGCSNESDNNGSRPQNTVEEQPTIVTKPVLVEDNEQAQELVEKVNTDVEIFNLEKVKETYKNALFTVADISERTYDGGNALSVTFSIPINPSEKFAKYLSVEDSKGKVDGSWILSDSGKIAYFEAIKPNTKYTVKVDWHLTSALGNQLANDSSAEIKTKKVHDTISFSSTGHYLPLDLHTGLPVTTVNVPEVDINFHRIDTDNTARVLNILGNRQQHGQYQLRQMAKAGEFVFTGRYQLPAEPNKRRQFNIPLSNIPELKRPGVYVAVMDIPGTYEGNIHTAYFMVTDLGLHIRRYSSGMDVYVNSIKSAKPIDGVKLQLVDYNGSILRTDRTSEGGLTSYYTVPKDARYLIAQYQDSYSILSIKQAALDLSEFDLGKRPYQENELFIYSERDLYRPGDKINFNALLRDFDGKLDRNTPLKAQLKLPTGQIAKKFSWKPTHTGFYEYEYQIDKNAKVGNWRLEVSGVGKQKVSYPFKVEEFLPERLKLTFNPNNEINQVFSTYDDIVIPILGEYLYGAPASGNRFDASINIGLNPHPFEKYKEFKFGDLSETQWNESFKNENEKMDKEGKKTLSIPSRWQNAKSPLSVKVFGSLYESGGRPVSRKHMVTVLPQKSIIGIRPAFKEHAPARGQAVFEIIKTDKNESKLAANNLSISLIREDRRYFWEYSRHEGWHYEYTEREYPEITTNTDISANSSATISLPVEYGRYRIEVTDPETGYTSSMKFRAGHDWYSWWRENDSNGQSARPDVVTLALDKENYTGGDKAILNIIPPTDGETIVVVEANKALWSTRLFVQKSGQKIEIPIDPKWNRHDIYVSAVHIQKADKEKQITPTRSFGLVHLPLNRDDRKLFVEFDAPEKWLPNQTVDLNLEVFKNKGTNQKPVNSAWVTVAAVDMGILNITNYKTPEPQKHFFEPRRYSADSIDIYNKLIKLNNNPLAQQRWGGDASNVSRGGKQARSEVQIVSLYSGLVDVKNGKANLSFELPDFNGRIKLMAVAFTEDSFGNGEQEVTIAAPLVTQLSMPRFVAWGDQSTLSLDINNLSGQPQQLEVLLTTNNAISQNSGVQIVSINDKEKQTLIYPIEVNGLEPQSEINLSVKGIDDYPIERTWKLNSRSAYPAITKSVTKVLEKDQTLTVPKQEFNSYIQDTIQASLSVSNHVDLQIRSQLDNLLRYPYGCLEQSTSSTYPWLFTDEQSLAQMHLKNSTGRTPAENVAHGLDRIFKKQKSNGAFGLWSNNDKYEQHWLTAYVGDFLTDATIQGFEVDKDMFNKTMNRLSSYIRSSSSYGVRWSEKPEHYQFSYQAYAAYVLARHNKANLGHLRNLMNSKDRSRSLLPLIHLGLALHLQGDKINGGSILSEAFVKESRSNYYYGDYGSQIRDVALAIHLLTRHKLESKQVFKYSIELVKLLKERKYLSTQERNALFLAGLALESGAGNEWKANVKFASALETIKHVGRLSKFHEGSEISDGISLTNQGENSLYASVLYSGYGEDVPQPIENKSIKIERYYYDIDGNVIDPSSLTVGDLVLVALDVETEKRMPDLMVIDLLPAGLELENQNLSNSASLDDVTIEGRSISDQMRNTDLVHQEYRDDRFVAAIDIGWNKKASVFYLARAVTPGTYKVPAPYAEDMYNPELHAIGNTINAMTISQ